MKEAKKAELGAWLATEIEVGGWVAMEDRGLGVGGREWKDGRGGEWIVRGGLGERQVATGNGGWDEWEGALSLYFDRSRILWGIGRDAGPAVF